MEPVYLSKDEAFMRQLHRRIEGISDSLESATTSWTYFKKQILLSDLYTYACTVLSYKPYFIPCANVSPDVLFITHTEHEGELSLYAKVEQSMQTITKNIHRTSITKIPYIGEAHEMDTILTILASEIAILQPMAVFLFYEPLAHMLRQKIAITPFTVACLSDNDTSRREINQRLQQLVDYITTLKG